MGVLMCQREGCGNIMCDRYSHKYGYICDECFKEMCAVEPPTIEAFMDSEKSEPFSDTSTEWYEAEFPIGGEN